MLRPCCAGIGLGGITARTYTCVVNFVARKPCWAFVGLCPKRRLPQTCHISIPGGLCVAQRPQDDTHSIHNAFSFYLEYDRDNILSFLSRGGYSVMLPSRDVVSYQHGLRQWYIPITRLLCICSMISKKVMEVTPGNESGTDPCDVLKILWRTLSNRRMEIHTFAHVKILSLSLCVCLCASLSLFSLALSSPASSFSMPTPSGAGLESSLCHDPEQRPGCQHSKQHRHVRLEVGNHRFILSLRHRFPNLVSYL